MSSAEVAMNDVNRLAVSVESQMDRGINPALDSSFELLRKLCDLVVMPVGKMSVTDRAFAADILVSTLEAVPVAGRVETARRLSGFADMPSTLLQFLATDELAVASIALQEVSHINEMILVEATQISPEHRKIIVQRDDVTSAVANALIKFDEVEVVRRLLKNENIELSTNVMDNLVLKSQHDETIRDYLLKRPELRHEHAFAMFWWVDSRHRKTLLARFATDRGVIQEALHELFRANFTSDEPDPVVRKILRLVDRRHRPRGKNGEMVTMDVVERTLNVARLNPSEEFAHAVGLLAGVSQEVASRVLYDPTGEPFAILCKSIGLGRNEYRALYTDALAGAEATAVLDEDKIDDLQGVFDSISRDYARTILRYWDWRSDLLLQSAMLMPTGFGLSQSEQGEPSGYFGAV